VRLVERAPLTSAQRTAVLQMRHPVLERTVALFRQGHAVLGAGQPLGTPWQRRLWQAAARPPWPIVAGGAAAGATGTTLADGAALLAQDVSVHTIGWCLWPPAVGAGAPTAAVALAEWRGEEPPVALVGVAILWLLTPDAAAALLAHAAPGAAVDGTRWVAAAHVTAQAGAATCAGWTYAGWTLADAALVRAAARAPAASAVGGVAVPK
jgi:hypothetical protein